MSKESVSDFELIVTEFDLETGKSEVNAKEEVEYTEISIGFIVCPVDLSILEPKRRRIKSYSEWEKCYVNSEEGLRNVEKDEVNEEDENH